MTKGLIQKRGVVLLSLTLATAALAAGVIAQAPDTPAPAPGGGPGRGGGFGGRFAAGTVTAVDATAGTITITPQSGGDSQTLQTSAATQIVSQVTVAASDLKVGDQVQVQGVPTGITASSVTVGQMPNLMPAGRGGFGGGSAGGGPGGTAAAQASATASGKVTATDPLTISLGSGVSLQIKLASKAQIAKISTAKLSSLKVGDKVIASGQTGTDGTFTATTVGVNVSPGGGFGGGFGRGGFGRGGFGRGGFGRGGFGGPGGGGPGGGGFGGPGGGGPGGPGGGGPGGPGGPPNGPVPPPDPGANQ